MMSNPCGANTRVFTLGLFSFSRFDYGMPSSPLVPQAPEAVPFDEVAAVLSDAASRVPGGPPALTGASGRHLAAALDAVGFRVVRALGPRPPTHTLMSPSQAPDRRRDRLMRLPIGELDGWHLLATCAACRQDRLVSLRSLLERYGRSDIGQDHAAASVRGRRMPPAAKRPQAQE